MCVKSAQGVKGRKYTSMDFSFNMEFGHDTDTAIKFYKRALGLSEVDFANFLAQALIVKLFDVFDELKVVYGMPVVTDETSVVAGCDLH